MTNVLQFNPKTLELTGPVGTLAVPPNDQLASRFLMLIEGQCLQQNITSIAAKYGLCRQRYYQLLADFKQGGIPALQPEKTGPKSNYRRTDQAVRQVLRYLFLDPDASPEVITQKLRQTQFQISLRSVQRVIADYGLQKKTLQPKSKTTTAAKATHPTRRKKNPSRTDRRSSPGT